MADTVRSPGAALAFALAAALSLVPAGAQVEPSVEGQVVDWRGIPVKGARVRLINKETGGSLSATTGRSGRFSIVHRPSAGCELTVLPPPGSGHAQAYLPDLPGKQTRHLVIHLHKGFAVSGRVTYDGKGVKGMLVQVRPELAQDSRQDVHGGGDATTDGDGRFQLTLTPGKKTLTVRNERYTGLAREVKQSLAVTEDAVLPDIAMPHAAD